MSSSFWGNAYGITPAATQDGGAFDTDLIPAGTSSIAVMAAAAGAFPYHCKIHPSMVGMLIVR